MSFQLANLVGQSLPAIRELPVATDEAFEKGALLVSVAGEWTECGADPTEVEGVALSRYGPESGGLSGVTGFNRLGADGFPPGFMQAVETKVNRRFSAEFVGDIATAVIGNYYGVTRGVDSKWRVDFDKAGNDVVELISKEWHDMLEYDFVHESVETSVVKGRNRVIVEFISAVVAVE